MPFWKKDWAFPIFRQNWANPSYGGGDAQPGCWYAFYIGDVDFIMLDCRYYRTDPKKSPRFDVGAGTKEMAERTANCRSRYVQSCLLVGTLGLPHEGRQYGYVERVQGRTRRTIELHRTGEDRRHRADVGGPSSVGRLEDLSPPTATTSTSSIHRDSPISTCTRRWRNRERSSATTNRSRLVW